LLIVELRRKATFKMICGLVCHYEQGCQWKIFLLFDHFLFYT
jgi:hypothetical protein